MNKKEKLLNKLQTSCTPVINELTNDVATLLQQSGHEWHVIDLDFNENTLDAKVINANGSVIAILLHKEVNEVDEAYRVLGTGLLGFEVLDFDKTVHGFDEYQKLLTILLEDIFKVA